MASYDVANIDKVAPVISNFFMEQVAGTYDFKLNVTASDNRTSSDKLKYTLNYKKSDGTTAGGTEMDITPNIVLSFTLDESFADCNVAYFITVKDEAGNVTTSRTGTSYVIDYTKPIFNGTPTYKINGETVTLNWNAAYDNVGVTQYVIKIGDAEYRTDNTHYSLENLIPGTYSYQIKALDAQGNASDYTKAVSFTIGDSRAPELHGAPQAVVRDYSVTVSWQAASDNVGVAEYLLRVGSKEYRTTDTSLNIAELAVGSYTYQLKARDAANNWSNYSQAQTFTIDDVTAPTLNGLPQAVSEGYGVTISWMAATDNVGVSGYHLYVDGTSYTVLGTSHKLNDLAIGNHTYSISAFDAAGNESTKSASQSFTIQEPADTTKPTISSVSLAQGSKDYTFTATVSASDNKTSADKLSYQTRYASSSSAVASASALSGKSFTLTAADAGKTMYYQVGVTDEAGNTAWSNAVGFTVKDVTAPAIGNFSLAQGSKNYVFTATVSASDNKTAADKLSYQIRYASSSSAVASASALSGKSFTLTAADAAKTLYYQVGVTDEAGNTVWSNATSFTVKDVTAPTLNGTPNASVNGTNVTFTWSSGSDNVGVVGYHLTVDGTVYAVSGTSYSLKGLAEGDHTYTLSAYDANGNESAMSAAQSFMIASQSELKGSTFQWSGTEYAYVQENGLSKGNFTWTTTSTNETGYMWTSESIIDAEKDSTSYSNFYLYMNTCWAATTVNMFMRSNWGTDIFATEDAALKYITETFTLKKITTNYYGVSGGQARLGLEWLFNGYYDYWLSSWSSPISTTSGGFYKSVTASSLEKYFSEQIIEFSSGSIQWCGDYKLGTGFTYTKGTFSSSYALLSNAFSHLKAGDAVGLGVSWHKDSTLTTRTGGHAITVYGFTYDESKKGTPYYFTGIIVADSDDDYYKYKGSSISLKTNESAEQSANRIKILDIDYNASKGVYVFSDYGTYGVIDGFQYLAQKPDGVSCSLSSTLTFSTNSDWNAAYSIATNEADAVAGQYGRISTSDDVVVALNLTNEGLGVSASFTVQAIVDCNEDSVLTFKLNKALAYDESSHDIVINLGKLSQGVHDVILRVIDGESRNETTISNMYVSYDSSLGARIAVQSGATTSGMELSDGQAMDVYANGTAENAVVGAGSEQLVKADGTASGTKVMSNGILTVESKGTAVAAEIFDNGCMVVNGNACDTTIHSGGDFLAGKASEVTGTTIEADGQMAIDFQGHADDTDVHGTLTVNNGLADDTTVYANGILNVQNTGKASGVVIQNKGKETLASGGYAENSTLTGVQSEQHISGNGSHAAQNVLDGASQIISAQGMASGTELRNGAVQDLSDGAYAFTTTLLDGSLQYIWNSTAYNTTVNANCQSFVFEGGLAVGTLVKSGGQLVVGDMNGQYGRGTGAARNLVVEYGGKARLENGACLSGSTTVAGTLSVLGTVTGAAVSNQDASPSLTFDFTDRTAYDTYIIDNIDLCQNLVFNIVVDGEMANGRYKLASNGAIGFTDTFSVYDDSEVFYGVLALDSQVFVNGHSVSLRQNGNSLNLVVEDSPYSEYELPEAALKTDGVSCSWEHVAKSSGYVVQFSVDNFQTVATIEISEKAVTFNNLARELQWRVRAKESNVWTVGQNVSGSAADGGHWVLADKNFDFDVLWAKTSGIWSWEFAAQHQGNIDENWTGTLEKIRLEGKNVVSDVFEGSSDGNMLLLTDDSNGDALFVDDIYTENEDIAEIQSRIAKIDEIRAGAGDDIVDMTSQRFAYVGDGVTIRGGLGNDVIWANKGGNTLFGDAGDDRLVGAAGDDTMAGGIGDDSIHGGGGGNDTICFCENWGQDTVEQLSGGTLTLWFAVDNLGTWDASTLTYRDGECTVTVKGIAAEAVVLKFGDDGSDRYDALASVGAFDEATSEKIFEDKTRGFLA